MKVIQRYYQNLVKNLHCDISEGKKSFIEMVPGGDGRDVQPPKRRKDKSASSIPGNGVTG